MQKTKWTIRLKQKDEILEKLREVKESSSMSYGELLTEAIFDWYENLPYEDDHID